MAPNAIKAINVDFAEEPGTSLSASIDVAMSLKDPGIRLAPSLPKPA
jgi:hypothetical protein